MITPNAVIFISDLHLSCDHPERTALFNAFLKGPAQGATSLYILGDFFDYYVGEDINTDFQQAIFAELKTFSEQGTHLYFMSGNRDFLLSSKTLSKANCQKLADPTIIHLHGVPTLLTHGDKLCTHQIAYQRYRKIAQHPLIRRLFQLLPKTFRQKIAQKLRTKSKHYQQNVELSFLDVSPAAVENVFHHKAIAQLIHGHVHQPRIHTHALMGHKLKRVVLGDWHTHCHFILCTPEKMTLSAFSIAAGVQKVDDYALEEAALPFSL